MNDDNKTPLAYQFRLRMKDLTEKAMIDGTVDGDSWNPDVLGYTVYGGDSLLQQNPALVADIVGYELEGLGATEADLTAIIYGMKARRYNDEFNRG